MIHFIDKYLKSPTHRITVGVIGAGGTGSQVLNGLARMDIALRKLNHKGLYVKCFDKDIVEPSNIGRQLFMNSEIGINKAEALINRLNRFFSLDWDNAGEYQPYVEKYRPNIYITCVDNVKVRKEIAGLKYDFNSNNIHNTPFYWIDYGNAKNIGQVVLGSFRNIKQSIYDRKIVQKKTVKKLKNVCELFPDMVDDNTTPSCSLAEALERQDLYINSTLANIGLALLWKLFREDYISYHGAFVNLQTFKINPIKI